MARHSRDIEDWEEDEEHAQRNLKNAIQGVLELLYEKHYEVAGTDNNTCIVPA